MLTLFLSQQFLQVINPLSIFIQNWIKENKPSPVTLSMCAHFQEFRDLEFYHFAVTALLILQCGHDFVTP